jgi:hypothetical protein
MVEDELAGGLPKWDERRKLYTVGLLSIPLRQLIPLLLDELKRVGLWGRKDASAADAPPEPGTVEVDVAGQIVQIRLDAYRDDDGHLRAEVREKHGAGLRISLKTYSQTMAKSSV